MSARTISPMAPRKVMNERSPKRLHFSSPSPADVFGNCDAQLFGDLGQVDRTKLAGLQAQQAQDSQHFFTMIGPHGRIFTQRPQVVQGARACR